MSREWVENATRVQAVYGVGDGVHAEGVVYAYTDQPTVLIRTDDGRTVSWVASLCREHPTTDRRVGGSSPFPPAVLLVPQNGCRVCGEEAPAGCRIVRHFPGGMHQIEYLHPSLWARLRRLFTNQQNRSE